MQGLLRIIHLQALLVTLVVSLAAQGEKVPPRDHDKVGEAEPAGAHFSDAPDSAYRIGPGDVLDVRVFRRPQLSTDSVRVDSAGTIQLPMIDERIYAACQTEAELSQVIAKHYREYLVDPQVTVFIKDYSSQTVNLTGAVQRPGSFQLKRRVRLRELITIAGGLSPAAGDTLQIAREKERLACDTPTDASDSGLMLINTHRLLAGDDSSNPYVAPGDFIYAGEAGRAYVVGNVYKPTPVELAEPVTLTKAIATAGGALLSSRNDVHILRRDPDAPNHVKMLVFSLKAIEKNGSEDPTLRPGDIVQVGTSMTKLAAKTALSSIANTGVIIYPLLVLQ